MITNLWLFRVTEKSDNVIDCPKVRLGANGMHEVEGRDYDETFSMLVKPMSICLVLTVAVSIDWKI